MKIYLASMSPRRKELLAEIVPEFEQISTGAAEKAYVEFTTKEKAVKRSKDKCIAGVSKIHENGMVVIASDTAVDLDGEILDKPKTKTEAFNMISKLSGKTHSVFTAVSVYVKGRMYTFCDETKVKFNTVPEDVIKEYVETDEPYDKAGGYAIQGYMSEYISEIDGDYNNVVGLPVIHLEKLLKGLKII